MIGSRAVLHNACIQLIAPLLTMSTIGYTGWKPDPGIGYEIGIEALAVDWLIRILNES